MILGLIIHIMRTLNIAAKSNKGLYAIVTVSDDSGGRGDDDDDGDDDDFENFN